ncbi:16S ribosomal RNA methyltransferase RsmE [Hyphomicrobium denitrificans 1NES1]|uniref:Ribosomal RNA small subunit methyltransferase E n=1 Tax=Hyphomicrobium denitrificans 1NES1 TaxID=670307 RepID=N0B7H6_9HYPH|nr:16S rRNA (uracil(1498)-N(3))-methyltransferase [Hyphomicrobium denitrificans]AGK58973.1 16S ribosomal RNA methyltransferase RsmE [Hyphomicrobium denitrificans 1NES1]
MAIRDLTSERLFIVGDLAAGLSVELPQQQAHYLTNVLRLRPGARLLVFNGRDGEWEASLLENRKRTAILGIEHRTRPQEQGPDIDYLFAPLKRARLDYMVQKATEMGVRRLRPVITERTIAERVNTERMVANVIEAAEQCGILRVPEVEPPVSLDSALAGWDPARKLIYCDEQETSADPIETLGHVPAGPVAVLIGPEGGFSDSERSRLLAQSFVVVLSLGPRIMRADTAAVAALTLVNVVLGDWRRI